VAVGGTGVEVAVGGTGVFVEVGVAVGGKDVGVVVGGIGVVVSCALQPEINVLTTTRPAINLTKSKLLILSSV
jgi:hypothetical protein